MADFNVDDLPDLTTETAKNKPFSVDDLPDLNVKKKDVPAPKLKSGSEATISSNGQSKSTSASTIVSKPNPNNQTSFTVSKENSFGIPNFQIPGVQKNTFQPLTEQQKAAGKKVLGEGTPLVEKKKVNIETPETSAKKSAILKAVTGKDISYDEVSRLSDVSNTDYAGILAAQKEKQKTDNTFAANPALQEEQRQEQVKQSEFLGNREFKVNNPQANVQILEQKNPTLLKDIADKTLELDEQRTAESFNKDKPVSQRFSKPKNDVPYKPFTDYLEVEELATVSPMELYETREKESDREKQFKYFKDRGADNVFNEYDNEQTAISFKQGELKKKHETALKNLKAKYGEDINNVEIPQDDKDFVDIIAAQNGLKENYNLSKDLLKTDKYAEVNKTIQERANRQVEIDKTAKDDTWYKFTDESNKIHNVVMNTAYGLVNDIASLPRFFNGLFGNNDFNWTDKVADATQRFTDAGMAYFNTPTDVQRDNVQDYAEVDGYRVFLDKKGNPTSLRDADNFMVNNDAKKEEIFSKYSDNKDKIKVKTDWIDGEQIMNQSSKIIGDMLVMIAEGGGIGAGIKGVGKVSRSARILNLAENAKLTTSLAVISQMQNEMMNDAIDKGMSKEDAAKYAAISSAGVAAISLINPMEAQFLKNIKNVKSLASEEVTSFLNGNTTLADLSKKTIGAVIGNSAPEIAEEQFFEPVLQNVVNQSYQSQTGVGQQLDQTDVLGRENLAQSVLTATTTFLPSALESSKNMNSNSIKMNILENPENWMAIIDKKKELGIIEDDIYSAEVAAMQKAKKKYDALKSEVKQSDRTKLAGLIGDKVAIESKLSDAPELKPKYEKQLSDIETKISNLTNGMDDAEAEDAIKPTIDGSKLNDIGEGEYKEFIDNGKVAPERLNNIAEKVKNKEDLSEREKAIFADKTAEINDIIKNGSTNNQQIKDETKITPVKSTEQAGAINIQSQDFGAEAKQDAKIESAVIEIGGKIYEGKNHAEAILKAKADGQDISQVNRQAEGKFKLSDGTIIDRAEAKTRFGQDRSELIIPQDDNAKQANKDYAKITKNNEQQTTTNVEQKSVNNDSSGLSETSKNVESNTTNLESKGLSNESEVPIAEQKVSEEVTATKEQPTPTTSNQSEIESKKADIERRREEALKTQAYNIPIKIETFEGEGESENIEQFQIRTMKDGTKQIWTFADGERWQRLTDKINPELTNEKILEGLLYTVKKISEDNNPPTNIENKTNAKHDAEYVDAVKKGEMTKEQAIKALEEVGRKNSAAYAELKALEEQTPTTLRDVESTAKALEDISKNKPTIWQSVKDAFNKGVNKVFGGSLKMKDSEKLSPDKIKARVELIAQKLGATIEYKPHPLGAAFNIANDGKFYITIDPKLFDKGLGNQEAFNTINVIAHELGHAIDAKEVLKNNLSDTEISELAKLHRAFINTFNFDVGEDISGLETAIKNNNKNITGDEKATKISDLRNPETNAHRHEQEEIFADALRMMVISPELAKRLAPNLFERLSKHGLGDNEHQSIAEAYHDAKSKGKETELTKAVESLLSKEQTPTDVKQKKAESEQGKLSNEDKIQQNATTEVQKQITEVEKIISELEDNPNSPFHKLVNLDEQKQKLSELQKKEAEVKKESAQPVLPETKAQKAANPRLSALPKKKAVPTEKVEEKIGEILSTKTEEITPKKTIEVDRNVDRADNNQENIETSSSKKLKTNGNTEEGFSGVFGEEIVDNKGNVVGVKISDTRPNGGKYYQTLVDDTPENRKGFGWQEHMDIDSKIFKKFETLDDLEKFINAKETPTTKEETKSTVSKTETTAILDEIKSKNHQGELDLKGKDLIGDALDRMADKIGSKKNLTQKEKTSLIKDVTDLAKGLIQEGKATLDNVIDKIKEAIKKRFPDLDENDLNDISENIKQKVLFDEAFQWYKDNDYTYEEAKKELDDNDVDYNEKDLKAIFAEKKEKSVNEKRLQNRAFDGTIDEELKSIIEDYGLTYETEDQIIAEKEANDIIEEVGLERAFQAVQNGYIKGAQAAVVYAKMVDELDTKLADDTITAEERTRLKELQAYSIDLFDTEAREAGRFLAMLNRIYHKSLFTYDNMVKSATKAKGSPLTSEEKLQLKEQSEKIAEFDKKIKELEAELEIERANNAVKNIKAQNNKPKTATFKAKAKALADKFRQLKSKPLVLKDADGNPIELTQNSIVSYNDIIELAAKAIEKTGELLDGINTALQEIKKQKWYQNLSQRDKDAVDRQVKEELLNLDTEVSDDKFKIPNSLLREIVRNGTEDIDGIVEKVLEVYGDIYPDLDARKVRDIITKYGETVIDSRDDIDKKISDAKSIGRKLSAKEDLLSGKLPKRSGFKRDKPGPTERLLMQEIQQLLKNVPKSQEELDALWATALDKAKNRVKNRIEELQLAIDKAEKINKSKNVQNYNDAGLDNLKAQLKEKQAEYDAAFPKEKSTLSDEQRLNQLINSKNKRLAKLEQQKIDKVYETNKKEGPDKSKFPELAKQIADLDAEIKKVTDDIKADETWKTHVEKKRIELAKKANQRRIDELKRRIDEKDFITKKNPTPVDDELKQLRREKHKVADDYELAKHKFELENRSRTEKAVDGILDVLTLPKSLKATLDLSAPLRQGATVLLSNPQIFWNSFIKMHGQAFSQKSFEDSIDEIMKSDNYTLAQDSGLQITDPSSVDERKQDDQFTVKLVNKIPIFNKLNQGSARAYSGFLNNIRFSLFEQGVKELENAGYKYEDNPKMFKALASTVNNLTGRGKSADGITGKFLNFIFFSPRMITSRVLLLHDLMRTDIPFNSPSRKMAAKSLLGTAVYIGLFNLLGTIASNASGDDDDKDRKPNFNPVATDFLKVRSKQTTFDPTAGYAPLIRTAARIAAEKSINSNGRETDLSKSYGSTRFTPAFDFLENKLSPTVSYLANVATHKNPNNKYESASEAEWHDYITGLVEPLQVMQVEQNFNDKDKFGKDLLEVTLGLYGIGVQQYDTSSKGKNNSRSSGSSSDSRGSTRGESSRGSNSRGTER